MSGTIINPYPAESVREYLRYHRCARDQYSRESFISHRMKRSVVGKVHGVSYCETSKRYNVRISGGKKNGGRNHGSHTTEAEAALAYNFLVLNRPPEDSLSQLLCRSMLSLRGASLHRSPDLQVLKLPKKDQRTKTLNVFATGTEDDEAENRLCGSL